MISKFIGDLLFGGFVLVLLVIFLQDNQQANALVSGFATTYVKSVTSLSQIGNSAASAPVGNG